MVLPLNNLWSHFSPSFNWNCGVKWWFSLTASAPNVTAHLQLQKGWAGGHNCYFFSKCVCQCATHWGERELSWSPPAPLSFCLSLFPLHSWDSYRPGVSRVHCTFDACLPLNFHWACKEGTFNYNSMPSPWATSHQSLIWHWLNCFWPIGKHFLSVYRTVCLVPFWSRKEVCMTSGGCRHRGLK